MYVTFCQIVKTEMIKAGIQGCEKRLVRNKVMLVYVLRLA